MKDTVQKVKELCASYEAGEIDDKFFKTSLMTYSFEAAGVSESEMAAFNAVLGALYEMKRIGRKEVLQTFRDATKRGQLPKLEEL